MNGRLLLGLAAALLGGSCGVPTEERAHPLPDVPVSLPTAAPTTTPVPQGAPAELFFVRGDRLAPTVHRVAVHTLAAVLETLAEGPTEEEKMAGMRSAIPVGASLRVASVTDGVAIVEVAEVAELGGGDQVLAVAQVVFTATGVDGVTAVRLSIGGLLVPAPVGDGTLVDRPIVRPDYPSLAPP